VEVVANNGIGGPERDCRCVFDPVADTLQRRTPLQVVPWGGRVRFW